MTVARNALGWTLFGLAGVMALLAFIVGAGLAAGSLLMTIRGVREGDGQLLIWIAGLDWIVIGLAWTVFGGLAYLLIQLAEAVLPPADDE